jgi:hypothetical protein
VDRIRPLARSRHAGSLAYLAAEANRYFAIRSYENCLREQAKKRKELTVSPNYIPEVSFECGETLEGGVRPGTGGNTSQSCGYKDWEISYDGGITWQYWGTFWT